MRFCDAALVASLLAAAPAMAGTTVANSEGMEIAPNLVPIPVAEPTPAAGAIEPPVAVLDGGVANEVPSAEKAAESLFETLIADFRWGDPEMGAVPHLPVPPPHKMRAEDSDSGEEAPLDGKGGNALPLHLVSLPLSGDLTYAAVTRTLVSTRSLRGAPVQAPSVTGRPEVPDTAGPDGTAVIQSPIQTNALPETTLPPTIASDREGRISDPQKAFEHIERQLMERAGGQQPAAGDTAKPASREQASVAPTNSGAATPLQAQRFDALAMTAALEANTRSVPTAIAEGGSRIAGGGSLIPAPQTTERSPGIAREGARGAATLAPTADGLNLRTSVQGTGERSASFEWLQHSGGREQAAVNERVASTDASQPFTLGSAASVASHVATSTAAAGSAQRADVPVLQLSTPIATPEWADSLGERVVWLTSQSLDNAHIRLNPAHLGPVEVRVSVTDDRASVAFVAHHAVTREALESAAPRLREMLQAQGFASVNVEIGQQSQQSASHRGAEQRPQYWPSARDEAHEVRAYAPARTPGPRSILDTFA